MSRRSHATSNETEMDMTPMIDCIFQLIIFFFLIIDLQNKELEPLVLPKAIHAIPDEPDPGRERPILNVRQDGTIVYRTKVYWSPSDGENYSKLLDLLKYFTTLMKKEMDPDLHKVLPQDALLIRADKWTEMHHITKIMELCGNQNILIWKVELAVGEPKDAKRKKAAK